MLTRRALISQMVKTPWLMAGKREEGSTESTSTVRLSKRERGETQPLQETVKGVQLGVWTKGPTTLLCLQNRVI